MILADTSIWIEHFRTQNPFFQALLNEKQVVTHELIVGELACGSLPKRAQTLNALGLIRRLPRVQHEEVLEFVEGERLYALGLGWIDMHLLASAQISGVKILTLGRAMQTAAVKLHLAPPPH